MSWRRSAFLLASARQRQRAPTPLLSAVLAILFLATLDLRGDVSASDSERARITRVENRESSTWAQYKWRILANTCVGVVASALLYALVTNLRRRVHAERSLGESEDRFRAVADATPILIRMSGPDKRCTYFNRLWLDFTGRELEEELGNGWVSAVHPDDAKQCFKTYATAFDAHRPFVMEYRLRRHDGEYRWISDTGRPRLDNRGRFAGYIGSCVDITETRRKAEALLESESRLRAILDTAVEAIITIDEEGLIESANAATEVIFGYAESELIGRNIRVLIPPPFRAEHDRLLSGYQRPRPSKIFSTTREVSGQRKDGSIFPMDLVINEIVLADRRSFTWFARDVTERKRAEQAAREFGGRLLRAQEAERARLARELHDDITQRLARLAIDAGRAVSWQDAHEQSEKMHELRDDLIRLSEDIHTLSYRLHPSLLGDLGLAAALRAECERFSKQSSVATDVKIVEFPAKIPADAALSLFRIAQEALRNVARHAGSKEAKVVLRPLDGGLQLAVVDRGAGFDPLKQRRPSLGLASMRERMHLLGGELDIESAPGKGTTILAWVPIKEHSHGQAEHAA